MKPLFILLAIVVFIRADEEAKEDLGFKPKFPKEVEELKSFKKFIEIVDANKMNVSIIISKTEKWNSGGVNDIMALSITPFPNDIHTTSSKLDKKTAQEFVDLAAVDRLTATVAFLSEDPTIISNNPSGNILDANLRYITTLRNEDRVDTILEEAHDIAGHITMHLPDKSMTDVYFADMNVEVVESENIEDKDLDLIKEYVAECLFEYEDDQVPRALVAWMDTKYPGNNWQATDNADQGFLVDCKKHAIFKTVVGTYGIFSS